MRKAKCALVSTLVSSDAEPLVIVVTQFVLWFALSTASNLRFSVFSQIPLKLNVYNIEVGSLGENIQPERAWE